MNTNINFVIPKSEDSLKQQKKVILVRIVAIIFLLIVGVVSIFLFLIIQITNPVSIKRQQEETLNEIKLLQDRRTKLAIVNERLDNIGSLLKSRRNFAENINSILSGMPDKTIFVDLDMNDTQIALTVTSDSLLSIDEFLNNLIGMAESKVVLQSLFLDDLTFDESRNNYIVSLKSEL